MTLKNTNSRYFKYINLYVSNDIKLIVKKLFEELLLLQLNYKKTNNLTYIIQFSPKVLIPRNIKKNQIFRISVRGEMLIEGNNKKFLGKYDVYSKVRDIYLTRERISVMKKKDIINHINKYYPSIKFNFFTFRKTLIKKIIDQKINKLFKN